MKKRVAIISLCLLVAVLGISCGWLFTLHGEEVITEYVLAGSDQIILEKGNYQTSIDMSDIKSKSSDYSDCKIEYTVKLDQGSLSRIAIVKESDGTVISNDFDNVEEATYTFDLGDITAEDSAKAHLYVGQFTEGTVTCKCYGRRYGYQKLADIFNK